MNPARLSRPSQQDYLGLVRTPVPFLPVTDVTAADKVIPGILSPALLRNNMVDGHGDAPATTILTLMLITLQDVFPGKNDIIARHSDVLLKFDDTGK